MEHRAVASVSLGLVHTGVTVLLGLVFSLVGSITTLRGAKKENHSIPWISTEGWRAPMPVQSEGYTMDYF